jgi:uncharacterized damage-inducible protein DinB
MSDPVREAAHKLVSESLNNLAASINGLSVDELNRRPSEDSNSIAVITTHALGATRLWLHLAMGLPLPERDRDAEFRAEAQDAEDFADFVQEVANDCLEALDSDDVLDWAAMRQTQGRGGDAPPEVTAAYALIHATEHLRGHVDQVALIRSLRP